MRPFRVHRLDPEVRRLAARMLTVGNYWDRHKRRGDLRIAITAHALVNSIDTAFDPRLRPSHSMMG